MSGIETFLRPRLYRGAISEDLRQKISDEVSGSDLIKIALRDMAVTIYIPETNDALVPHSTEELEALGNRSRGRIIGGVQRYSQHTRFLTEHVAELLPIEVDDNYINAVGYFSEGGERVLPVHADGDDVYSLQVNGVRRFNFYGEIGGAQIGTVDTLPGDLLHIPEGLLHAAHPVTDSYIALCMRVIDNPKT